MNKKPETLERGKSEDYHVMYKASCGKCGHQELVTLAQIHIGFVCTGCVALSN